MEKNMLFKKALKDINDLLKHEAVDNNNLLTGHRINHKTDLEQLDNAKIVFSEPAFKKLVNIINDAINNDFTEYGTYFYGDVLQNVLYIEYSLSNFESSNGIYKSGAVDVTEKNLKEMSFMTEKTSNNHNPFNIVMHFHTHPDHIKDFYGNILTPSSLLYSENDLYSYAYQQKYLQPTSNNPVIFLGCLVATNYGNPQINCVLYDERKQNFINIPNIYYINNDKVFKFNNVGIMNDIPTSQQEIHEIKERIRSLKDEK